jgi:hypothetical protein
LAGVLSPGRSDTFEIWNMDWFSKLEYSLDGSKEF